MDQDQGTGAAWFTLGVAAKQAGISKPTLSKAIKNGRISAEKQPDGSYRIQPGTPAKHPACAPLSSGASPQGRLEAGEIYFKLRTKTLRTLGKICHK